MAKRKNWLPYLIYSLLSLAILGPLLLPGYILTLDMMFTPSMNFSPRFYGLQEGLSSAFTPFYLLMQLTSKLVPMWLLQKIILFLIFFLAGLGMHRLFPFKGAGSYFAGLLYVVNPFTYARFLAGQWTVLVSYTLMPFAIMAFLDLLGKGGGKNVIKVAVLSTLVGIVQTHGLFLLLLVFLVIFLVKVIKERKALVSIAHACKYLGISTGLFLVLNIYWLVPVLLTGGFIVEQVGQADILLFAPRATSRIMFDVASMYGFWRGGYLYTQDILPFWWLLFLLLLFFVVYGSICRLNDSRHKWIVISFGIIGIVSFLLAVGVASNLTRLTFEWLWAHISIIKGFRDSHKFVALLCLSYAYLGGISVNEFANILRTQRKRIIRVALMALLAVMLLTPLGYTFTIFGFYGQIGVTGYPKEWYEVNEYLNNDKNDFNILFLPWHQYMDYHWLPNMEKRLTNPARAFFDKPVIQGDNIEMPGIYSQSTNPVSKYVELVLGNKNVSNLGELLAPLDVKYVILVHEADYESYAFLYEQRDLSVEIEKPGITLFRNEHPTARVYAVDSVVHIVSLEEIIELSTSQDVMEHLYVLGSGADEHRGAGMEKPDFTVRSPVKYSIKAASNRYVILAMPQNVNTNHWEYDGKESLKNLGVMPAFESPPQGGEAVYTRFYHVYLPSYIVSILTLIFAFVVRYYVPRNRGPCLAGTLSRIFLKMHHSIHRPGTGKPACNDQRTTGKS